MLLEQVWVVITAEELKILHLADIVDDCELLSQVGLEADSNLVTPGHVPAAVSL